MRWTGRSNLTGPRGRVFADGRGCLEVGNGPRETGLVGTTGTVGVERVRARRGVRGRGWDDTIVGVERVIHLRESYTRSVPEV